MGACAEDTEESGRTRLLAVLLVDALETLGREPRGDSAREVRTWVCAAQDGGAFSFARACDTLGLPVVHLRRRLGLRPQAARRGSGRGFSRSARTRRRPTGRV